MIYTLIRHLLVHVFAFQTVWVWMTWQMYREGSMLSKLNGTI